MAEVATLPRLLLRNARDLRDRPAIREKDRGIWQSWTWRQYHDHVRDLALGLAALGFDRGHRLSVIGDNRPRLYWAQVAAQALGGVSVPVYQDSIAKELAFVWNHADVSVIVAEDQEQVDKVVTLRDQLPHLRWVIYDDPRGMFHYKYDWLLSFAELQERGREYARAHPGAFEAEIEQGAADDVAFICYTSGTTGSPKGAMLTHANALATAAMAVAAEDIRVDDDYLAYLPMAWVGDAFYTLILSLYVGFTCNCPESPETVQRDLRELGPTLVLAPPRIWENMLTAVQVRAADAPALKRRVFETFRASAERAEILRADGKPVPLGLRLACALGEFFVYGPVRDQLGLRRARWALTGGAPLGPDTFRFFRSIGVNLKQVYGSTETTGLVSLQPSTEANPTTAGRPCPGIEVRIGDRGEVLVKGAGIFQGYLKNDEATREVIDPEGWFHTGDAGFLDPRGHLVIIDRAKDVGALADGTPVRAPVHREQAQVQSLRPGGGGLRPRPAVRDGHDRHRPHHGRQLGGAARPRLHELRGPQPEAGDRGPHPRRDPQGQRDAAGGPEGPALPSPHQGPRRRRRRDDAHARRCGAASWPRSMRTSSTPSTRGATRWS